MSWCPALGFQVALYKFGDYDYDYVYFLTIVKLDSFICILTVEASVN